MAEDIDELENARKEIVQVLAHIEGARKLAEEVAAGTDKQNEALASLGARIGEAESTATQVVHATTAHLDFIEDLRKRAEEALKQIEEHSRKASSESGFALNAKGNAEEHAKAISQIRGVVESTFAGLTTTRDQTDALVQAIVAARAAADADATLIGNAKGNAALYAAQLTAASERVAAVLPSIEQGSKDANTITAAKAGAEAGAAAILLLQTQMAEMTAKATADGTAISEAEAESKKLVSSMTDARDRANDSNARLVKYEEELKRLTTAFSEIQLKLEGLLPHATSVGLASAFHIQKARFSKSQPYWLAGFALAIAALLITAATGISAVDTWDAILRHLVNRLPIIAPLVWLAIYAGHHYNMALRMEEDYAFKEAVSTAFEGYKREMLSIPPRPGSDVSPLVILCENVLRALAERPGRIYDGKSDVVTPLTPATAAFKEIFAEIVKAKDAKP